MTFRFSIVAAAAALASAPSFAQGSAATGGYLAARNDPAAQLSANLVILSQNPRDVNALIGAGQSAVAVGDGNAALAFLARAEEISPRNGRIKAALGSALLLLERPGEALKLFSEASALGIPDVDIAADRGLAHDLRGESRKAQRDYLLAQRIAPSDELTRRLALSYGISGDRASALSLLDPLLRKQDQAAWRARAFVLAMTGDLSEAETIASTVMPGGTGNGMSPFLRRLATLSPADRAMAVNFGSMPGDGTRLASNDASRPYSGGVGGTLIPAGDIAPPRVDDRPTRTAKAAVTRDPRRRPGAADPAGVGPGFSGSRSEGNASKLTPPTAASVATPWSIERQIETQPAPVAQVRRPPEIRVALAQPAPTALPVPVKPTPAPTVVAAASMSSASPARPAEPALAPATGAPVDRSAVIEPMFEIPADTRAVDSLPAKVAASAAPTPGAGTVPVGTAAAVVANPAPLASSQVPIQPGVTGSGQGPSPTATTAATATSVQTPAPNMSASVPAPDAAGTALATSRPSGDPGAAAVASFARPAAQPIVEPAGSVGTSPSPEPARLADIIATIEPEPESVAAPLPTAAELRAARVAQQKKLAAQTKAEADAKAEKDAKEAAKREAAKHPPRVWVQVATGANEAGLPSTWKRIRDRSPQLFKGLGAASVPFKATNRLLVGPLKSQAEARALVNALQKAGMAGTTYSSEAGQEIARIASK